MSGATTAYEMDYAPPVTQGDLAPSINAASDMISRLQDTAQYNSAQSAEQARIQREWQEKQNAKAMEFNASEAAKNRDWQEMMSNTAHQREIKDLKAAGLNPILSAMGGNGAAVTSGATASGVTSSGAKGETDMSMNTALVNLLGSIYNRTTQLEAANINARTQEAVADKYNATSEIVAQISAAASRYGADASKYSANMHYASSKYSADMQKFLTENYPNNLYQALPALIGALTGQAPSESINGAVKQLQDWFSGKHGNSSAKGLFDGSYRVGTGMNSNAVKYGK